MKIQEFDYRVDLLQAILWQYDNSPNIKKLLDEKQFWYDINQTIFWDDWYINVFNLLTANVFGLAVWSFILDLPLFVPIAAEDPSKPIFGFNEVTVFPSYINSYLNFENSNFSSRDSTITLTIEEQRLVLRLRYFQLVSRGAMPEINTFLNYLFKTSGNMFPGTAWCFDNLDMTITYVFDFAVSNNLLTVLKTYDLLPRPAGVGINYIILTGTVWGFGEFNQNFENGDFIPENI